jgi:pimeloyl-ACP methyl ester carboxylesterase
MQPDLSLYLDGGITAALHQQIVEPALLKGYRRIWLLGISIGGMGALLYAAEHAELVEQLILLAPFIGTKGTLAAQAEAGGLACRLPESGIATEPERKLLGWLRDYLAAGRQAPKLLLGYGGQDRFARGHRMLAENLPPDNVVTLPGGHDWECWRAVWLALLAAHPATGLEGDVMRPILV